MLLAAASICIARYDCFATLEVFLVIADCSVSNKAETVPWKVYHKVIS